MDADKMLAEIRAVFAEIGETAYTEPLPDSRLRVTNLAVRVMGHFQRLDAHLSSGGRPPEEWVEGPDAPGQERLAQTFGRFVGLIHTTAEEGKSGREGEMHAALVTIANAAETFLDELDAAAREDNG